MLRDLYAIWAPTVGASLCANMGGGCGQNCCQKQTNLFSELIPVRMTRANAKVEFGATCPSRPSLAKARGCVLTHFATWDSAWMMVPILEILQC